MNKNLLLVVGLLAATSVVAGDQTKSYDAQESARQEIHDLKRACHLYNKGYKGRENPCLKFEGMVLDQLLTYNGDGDFRGSNFSGSSLEGSDLRVKLDGSNFKGAKIDQNTVFNNPSRWSAWFYMEKCILPSGEYSNQCSREMHKLVQGMKAVELAKQMAELDETDGLED